MRRRKKFFEASYICALKKKTFEIECKEEFLSNRKMLGILNHLIRSTCFDTFHINGKENSIERKTRRCRSSS